MSRATELAEMLEKDGYGCTCMAYSRSECVCDAVWAEDVAKEAATLLRKQEAVIRQCVDALEETTALCINFEAVEEKNGYEFTEAKIVIPMGVAALASAKEVL